MTGRSKPALLFLVTVAILTHPSSSDTDTFVYGGCSKFRFSLGSAYESNLNSLLSSLVNSAAFNPYANLTVEGASSKDTIQGLFQCRGDLNPQACSQCVSRAVARLGTLCAGSVGGAMQLEGCLVKYDNQSFFGVEDKTLVAKNCGAPAEYDDVEALTKRDEVLGQLGSSGGAYRVGGSGKAQGMAQCVGDLGPSECQDCVAEAIERLQKECGPAKSADVYLAKCYVRFASGGSLSRSNGNGNDNEKDDDKTEKTLAIIIGLIAGVILLVVFLSFIGRQFRKLQGDGKDSS